MPATGHLPADLTSLVGRVREGREVRKLLGEARLVTLTGPGGVGKTRVALHVGRTAARAFPDGVWFVELAALQDAAMLDATVAAALGHEDVTGHNASLANRLRPWRGLIILDNCEHLVEACARLAHELLAGAPHLTILATSREALGTSGEHVVRVQPLAVPERGTSAEQLAGLDSVRLFTERSRAFDPGFAISSANANAIAHICRSVDGIPLALELAAARLHMMSVQQIAERIEEPFGMLNRAPRNAPRRQASLDDVIAWSYRLCSPEEQRFWARMSVFTGPADAATLQRICDVPPDANADVLEGLVRKSIVVREGGVVARFSLLETIRQYGHRQLDDEELAEVRRRHTEHYESLVARCIQTWFSAEQLDSARTLRSSLPNLRVALDTLIRDAPERALVMSTRLHMLWVCMGRLREGDTWMTRALAAAPADTPERAHALWVHGFIQLLLGDKSLARTSLTHSLATARITGQDRAIDWATALLAMVDMHQGELDSAVAGYKAAIDRRQAAGDSASVAYFLGFLAAAYWADGDVTAALDASAESVDICRAHGEHWCTAHVGWIRSLVLARMGRHAQALESARESLHGLIALDDTLGILLASEVVGWNLAARGSWYESRRLQLAIEPRWRDTCSPLAGFADMLDQREMWAVRTETELGRDWRRPQAAAAAAMDLHSIARLALAAAGDHEPELGSQPAPRTTRGPLTPRETQVAELMADGMSNRAIAERLVISIRTAEVHVLRILTKLGLSGRGQVAGWWQTQQTYPDGG